MTFSRTRSRGTGALPQPRHGRRLAAHSLAAAAVCAAVAVTAAGCSSGGSGGGGGSTAGSGTSGGTAASAMKELSLAASQARQVTSYTATMHITSTGTFANTLAGAIAMQTRPLMAHQTFDVTSGSTTIPGGLETLLTSHAVYMKIASLAKITGKPWIKVPFSSLKKTGVNLAPLIQQLEGSNPLAQTQMVVAAGGNVHKAGSAVINGVPTTEYTGSYSEPAGLARLSPALRKLAGPALAITGIKTTQFTIWVDGQHQVRKLSEVQSGPHMKVTSMIVVTSINQPVHIQIPPASQVGSTPGF